MGHQVIQVLTAESLKLFFSFFPVHQISFGRQPARLQPAAHRLRATSRQLPESDLADADRSRKERGRHPGVAHLGRMSATQGNFCITMKEMPALRN